MQLQLDPRKTCCRFGMAEDVAYWSQHLGWVVAGIAAADESPSAVAEEEGEGAEKRS